ncbi:hypothetical protein KAS41_02730 [Candidatus Parcubacteria bacterium]|nr:hypothetical protein [Candidatus Parcubacteria bacterium]
MKKKKQADPSKKTKIIRSVNKYNGVKVKFKRIFCGATGRHIGDLDLRRRRR